MGARIHIVDDDVALGKFLSREFKRNHYTVDVSHDGQDACEKIEGAAYDLVVLDLNLPGLDGMTVLERVRLSHPLLPILVLTARSRKQDLGFSARAGRRRLSYQAVLIQGTAGQSACSPSAKFTEPGNRREA